MSEISQDRKSILHVDHLQKTFVSGFLRKRVEAVKNSNFEIFENEIVGLVGPNGAGKTTTMKMITGLVRPNQGSVTLFGVDATLPESRARLGYLPENPYFYEHLTGRELLRFYANLFGLHGKKIEDRINTLIDEVGMGHAADRPIKAYSKGMRQRIGIAQALVNDPDLVILDEPQSGLDPIGRKEIRDIIVRLKRNGKTVVFSSHIIPDVEAVCDRIIVMKSGRSRELGPSDWQSILSHKKIECILSIKEPGKSVGALTGDLVMETGVELTHSRIQNGMLHVDVENQEDAQKIVTWAIESGLKVYGVVPKEVDFEGILLNLIQ